MTTQTEFRYLQKLARWIDGSLSHHWITLEIIQTQEEMITYRLVGGSGLPLTEPLKDLLDREYRPVAIGEMPEQFKVGVYAENETDNIPDADRCDYLVEDEEETEPDNVTTYQIPTIYLSLIFNDDATGLEDEDIELFDEFIEREGLTNDKGYWSYPDNEESYFTWSNDLSSLGADVTDLQWINMSNTSTKESDFDVWLSQNYIPAGEASDGEEWYLSISPNEFMPFPLSEIKQKWESENLPADNKQYWLVVTDNRNSNTIYLRELTNDGDLLMVPRSYIPEIQEATDILIDRNTANYPGCGQIGITIGFSPTPQNDVAVWDTEDYNLISLNQYICTCSNSDRSYIFEAQNEQKAITQMLQNFPDAQNVVANLNTGRKITPRKRQLR